MPRLDEFVFHIGDVMKFNSHYSAHVERDGKLVDKNSMYTGRENDGGNTPKFLEWADEVGVIVIPFTPKARQLSFTVQLKTVTKEFDDADAAQAYADRYDGVVS